MKKLYSILKMVLWCFVGVFVGSSIYQYCDYKAHPGLYEMQSAPWYFNILIRGVFTAIIVAAIFIAMRIIKRKHFIREEISAMRHFYIRLVLGIVWVVAAVVSAVTANVPFAALGAVLGIVFLYSAYSVWKKEKGNRR